MWFRHPGVTSELPAVLLNEPATLCILFTVCACMRVCVSVCVKLAILSFQLRSGGSQILEGCIAEIPNISSLDISDNGEITASMHNVPNIYGTFKHLLHHDSSDLPLYYRLYLFFSTPRPGCRPLHSAGVVSQEPIHQAPLSGQELQQHQVQVRIQCSLWRVDSSCEQFGSERENISGQAWVWFICGFLGRSSVHRGRQNPAAGFSLPGQNINSHQKDH